MTVLILNYQGWRDTIACLESVLRLDYPDFNVVVCDNASPDGSVQEIIDWAEGRRAADIAAGKLPVRIEAVRKPILYVLIDRAEAESGAPEQATVPLTIIRTGANGGFAAGNNVGLRFALARGVSQYVWLLNNDTITAPDALRHLVEEAERDGLVGAVGGTLLELNAPDTVQLMAGGRVAFWGSLASMPGAGAARSAPRIPPPLDYVSGGCLLVSMAAVRTAGLLDERFFMYGEDADWSRRFMAEGFRLAYAPAAEVWHRGGGTAGHGSALHDYHSVRSSLLYVHKHRPRMLPVAAAYCLYRCLLPKFVRGQWGRARAVIRAIRDSLAPARKPEHGRHRGRYLVRNRLWRGYLRVADGMLATMPPPRPARTGAPGRILIAVGGHLGDAVIATSAMALVRSTFPEAQIGVLAPSWARPVLDGHPDVSWLHHVDHWKLQRGLGSVVSHIIRHRALMREAVGEIRDAGYDVAVDLYPFYPNMAPVLRRAGIPVRAGWASGGYGPMFTHPLAWTATKEHVTEQHARLLRSVFPEVRAGDPPGYRLPVPTAMQRAGTVAVLREHGVDPQSYCIVHPCAGTPLKDWPLERWVALLRTLVAAGGGVVVTGAGEGQAAYAGTLVREVPGVVSLVNRLSWPELVSLVDGARAVVAVDTAVAHVAAAMNTPGVTLMTGPNDPEHWRPYSSRTGVLTTAPERAEPPGAAAGMIHRLSDIEVRHVLAAIARVTRTEVASPGSLELAGHAK